MYSKLRQNKKTMIAFLIALCICLSEGLTTLSYGGESWRGQQCTVLLTKLMLECEQEKADCSKSIECQETCWGAKLSKPLDGCPKPYNSEIGVICLRAGLVAARKEGGSFPELYIWMTYKSCIDQCQKGEIFEGKKAHWLTESLQ